MFSELNNLPSRRRSPAEESRFKDVDSDVLLYLYENVNNAFEDINHALEHATAAQTLYFSADARSCKETLKEIKRVLFTRGIREFASTQG